MKAEKENAARMEPDGEFELTAYAENLAKRRTPFMPKPSLNSKATDKTTPHMRDTQ